MEAKKNMEESSAFLNVKPAPSLSQHAGVDVVTGTALRSGQGPGSSQPMSFTSTKKQAFPRLPYVRAGFLLLSQRLSEITI